MKKIFLIVAFFTTLATDHSFAQDIAKASPIPKLLSTYFDIKNALVSSDTAIAAAKAGELANAINGIDMKTLSETDRDAFKPVRERLLLNARYISETKDISHQREHFSSISDNMYKLAKSVNLSAVPVYQQYCSMKKMYWLSTEAAIKNPYYGSKMLTCGKVTDTIN